MAITTFSNDPLFYGQELVVHNSIYNALEECLRDQTIQKIWYHGISWFRIFNGEDSSFDKKLKGINKEYDNSLGMCVEDGFWYCDDKLDDDNLPTKIYSTMEFKKLVKNYH